MVSYHGHDRDALLEDAEKTLLAHKVVENGDIIVVSVGEPIGVSGGTNTLKIVKVGENRKP
jgi:pyruvate kinase